MSLGRRSLLALAVLAAAAAGFFLLARRDRGVRYLTTTIDRGDVVETVGATGNLQAVTTVQVGSQVSGTIESLGADFNSMVRKGQVIARLDPSLFEARLGQAKANLTSALANVERARAEAQDTRQKYERARKLSAEDLLPESDLETAKAAQDSALAQLRASEAAVSQAEANVNQAQVDLDHTVITTPIDGVVINRSVDVGQTVAASFQAPVLFVIANDLAHMQVNAAVDEADIGRVRPGQAVTFRVDAYPERSFPGRVEQVRLQPQTIQNVVSYNTIISVDNSDQKLMPGMTATVSVIVHKAENALRLPSSILRFRPEGARGGPGRGQGRDGVRGPGAVEASERPESRERGARSGDGPGDRGRRATVYTLGSDARLEAVPVRLGVSDGQYVELREGLAEGATVVTGIEGGGAASGPGPRPSPSPSSPFNPGPPPRRQR